MLNKIEDNYLDPVVSDLFRMLANCFLLFRSDMAVFIFPTLLLDLQKPNEKSAQGHTII